MAIHERMLVFGFCINVYLLTEGIVYLGCYEDSSKRVLPKQQPDASNNTPTECARRCSAYRYAGVEYEKQCFCGDSLSASQKQESECNYTCPGNRSEICGGFWRISVYINSDTACGPTPAIANGNATLRKDTNLTFGSIADVYCDPGFMGKQTITCLSNTSWEETTCEQRGTTTTTTLQTSGTTHTLQADTLTHTKATSLDISTSSTTSQYITSLSAIDRQSATYKGSRASALAAGVSVTVTIAILVVVIVLVLRNKKKLCFANTKRSTLENIENDHHITLAKEESKVTAFYEIPGTPASNQTYGDLQNASSSIKNADKYYASVDNSYHNAESKHHDLYRAPCAPVLNHSHSGLYTGNTKAKEHDASAVIDVNYQHAKSTHGNPDSDTHAYFVLEKDVFEKQRNVTKTIATDAYDYFVLEKQQPIICNNNVVSANELHPYFVLEKERVQPVHSMPQKAENRYFELEKQNASNSTPISTANTHELENDDGDMYQEIDTNDTYADIDDSRMDNTDYDYKTFRDSTIEISDNVYNHLKAGGDEYDTAGKRQDNDTAMENDYDITSGAVRK